MRPQVGTVAAKGEAAPGTLTRSPAACPPHGGLRDDPEASCIPASGPFGPAKKSSCMIQTVDARFPLPLQAPHHRGLILASRPGQDCRTNGSVFMTDKSMKPHDRQDGTSASGARDTR